MVELNSTIDVKPAPGRAVRDPQTGKRLPRDSWSRVTASLYYLRLLSAGDLVSRAARRPEKKTQPDRVAPPPPLEPAAGDQT